VADDPVAGAARTLLVDRVTVEVIRALEAARVSPVLLKGPTFSALLYPEGGRSYGDTDLLVAPEAVEVAADVLGGLGFVETGAGRAADEHGPAREFARVAAGGGRHLVDLHWAIDAGVDAANAWKVLSSETERFVLGPIETTSLSSPARAMHVALHAAQHGLLGPQPDNAGGQTGEDLRRAVALLPDDVWRRAASIATACGSADAFAFGLRMTAEGAALSQRLGLPSAPPDLWRFAGGTVPRGAQRVDRVRAASTLREKLRVIRGGVFPTPAHVRLKARSAIGRRTVMGAYAEYWWTAARGLRRGIQYVRGRRTP
jgi:hypothetical protein